MRKLIIFTILSISLWGCNTNEKNQEIPVVSVSIIPQQYFVDRLSGNHVKVNVMIPPGAGHSTYEPLPSQMRDLNKSKIYFKIGHIDFEYAWMERFKNSNKQMKVVDLSEGLDLSAVEATPCNHHHHEGEHHHHSSIDPHIWLNPEMVKPMVSKIASELCLLLPKDRDSINIRKKQFIAEIDSLDKYITQQMDNLKSRKFLIFHPALTWYAYRYGLEQITIEVNGKEPSPSEMGKIIQTIKDNNIKVLLIQSEFPFERAVPISKETGVEIIQINPLAYDWLNNMYKITSTIKQALSK